MASPVVAGPAGRFNVDTLAVYCGMSIWLA